MEFLKYGMNCVGLTGITIFLSQKNISTNKNWLLKFFHTTHTHTWNIPCLLIQTMVSY